MVNLGFIIQEAMGNPRVDLVLDVPGGMDSISFQQYDDESNPAFLLRISKEFKQLSRTPAIDFSPFKCRAT